MKILIVEDNEDIRTILKYNLELDGHEISLACNGNEALEMMDEPPDLILLDIMMPVMDGFSTCKLIKENPVTKNVPIFMLTAKSQITDIEEAFRVGADDYLTKPFDPINLCEKIMKKYRKYQESLDE